MADRTTPREEQKPRPVLPEHADLARQTGPWVRVGFADALREEQALAGVVVDGERVVAETFGRFAREVFARLYSYEDPVPLARPAPGAEWAQLAHGLVDEVPEWQMLRDRCQGNDWHARLATVAISEHLLKTGLPRLKQPLVDAEQAMRQAEAFAVLLFQAQQEGADSDLLEAMDQQAKQAHRVAAQAADRARRYAGVVNQGVVRNAVRAGVSEANQQIDDLERALVALPGIDDGVGGQSTAMGTVRRVAERLLASPKLRRIAELAGRLIRIARDKQATKADVHSDVESIEEGDDLALVLPDELLLLAAGGAQAAEFGRRLVEGKLLQYRLRGTEQQARGPIVVCLDDSGSMAGAPEVWSKAVALALLDVARHQRRSFAVVHFDTRVGQVAVFDRAEPVDYGRLLDALDWFSGGGTCFEPPLREALRIIGDKLPQADIVFVTDDAGSVSVEFRSWYRRECAARGVVGYGVAIGVSTAVMDSLGFRSVRLTDLTRDEEVHEQIFSL